jgi:hypothetical protein
LRHIGGRRQRRGYGPAPGFRIATSIQTESGGRRRFP